MAEFAERMKTMLARSAIRLVGMLTVAASLLFLKTNFIIFLVMWLVGWFVYDLHALYGGCWYCQGERKERKA